MNNRKRDILYMFIATVPLSAVLAAILIICEQGAKLYMALLPQLGMCGIIGIMLMQEKYIEKQNEIYRNRLDAGLNLNASSARRCVDGSFEDVPYFVDLGLFGNYSFKHGWSAWAHLGNLLCGEIQRHPGLVEKGPYITLGFTLSVK